MKTEISHSMDLTGTLFIIFLVLKLTKLINWSWWWVTSPLWIPVALLVVCAILYGLFKGFSD